MSTPAPPDAPRPAGWRTLGLPLRAVRGAWLASAGVLIYYLATMARDLSFYDSAELATVAVQGGLGHPLGQPLHTWLGWLVTHLPGVPPLLALNGLSALCSALAVIPLVSLAEALTVPRALAAPPAGDTTAVATASAPAPGVPRGGWRAEVGLPLGVGLLFLHPTLWENGTRVEVYALALACGAWGLARAAATLAPRPEGGAGWFAAGVALGLAASANAYMATVVAVGLAPALGVALWRRRLGVRAMLRAVGGGLVGLLPFVHLPLTAGRTDVFVWGAPTGGDALARYLRNADFDHNRGLGWAGFFDHLASWSHWAVGHGLVALVVLGLVGHGLWGRRAGLGRGWALIAFGITVVLLCINVIFFPEVTDYLGYLSLPLAVLGVGAVALVWHVVQGPGRQRLLGGALGAAVLASVVLAPPGVFQRTRHRDRLARVLAAGALEDAPPRAVLLVASDHWVFPLLYLQEVERRRPDVVVVPLGLADASWQWALLHRRHPDLRRFALRGKGGRVGRIRRFLAANPDRPVLYESFATAMIHGEPACPGRWLVRGRGACAHPGAQGPDRLTAALEEAVDRLAAGSPPAGAVLARVALERGELLWRYGLPAEALRALRAGVPRAHRPAAPRAEVAAAGRLREGPLRWRRVALIGHFSRNLYLAAKLLAAAGAEADALAHLRAAAEAGLPEARTTLKRRK